jgi:hypothetical protein
MNDFLKNRLYLLLTTLVVLVFIAFKWSYLNLPFYWDEAWVYGPAVKIMSENPSLLPAALHPDLSRGHPLFFHYIFGVWGKLISSSNVSLHILAHGISILLIYQIFFIGSLLSNQKTAFLTVVAFTLQPIFLAQSGLVLPEVLLALTSLSALYFYLTKRWFWYFVVAAISLLVKESALILILAVGVHFFAVNFKTFLNQKLLVLAVISPIIPYLIFLLIQKAEYGWYFFPEHLDLVNLSKASILNQLKRYSAYLFLYQGRNLFTFSALFLFLFQIFQKHDHSRFKFLITFFVFILFFLLFSSANFYSDRYLMVLTAPVLIICFTVLSTLFKSNKATIIASVIIICSGVYANQNLSSSDHNLGYADAVKCHQDMVEYLVENNLQEKNIYAAFLGANALTNPHAGYVYKPFKNISKSLDHSNDIVVVSSFEKKHDSFMTIKNQSYSKIVEFKHGRAWVKLMEP